MRVEFKILFGRRDADAPGMSPDLFLGHPATGSRRMDKR